MKPLLLWAISWALLHPVARGEETTSAPSSEVRSDPSGELDLELPPPIDPTEVAATIDDAPVPRYLVRLLEQQHMGAMRTLIPEIDESKPWTKNRALAGAIRMVIARNHMQQVGLYPTGESIEEFLNNQFDDPTDKTDDDWIRQTGATRAHLAEWLGLYCSMNVLFGDLVAEHEQPSADQALRDFYEAHAALYGTSVDTDMVFVPFTRDTPGNFARCNLRAEQLAEELRCGRTAADLEAFGELYAEPVAQAFSHQDASLVSFHLSASKAIAALKPGELTEPMAMGKGVVVFALRAIRPSAPPDFESVKDSVWEHWRENEVIRHAHRWFEEREAAANIQVLETSDSPQ